MVPAVPDRFPDPFVLTVLQRMNERQHTLQVENRVRARHLIRQDPARFCRGQPDRRCRHDEAQVVRPRPSECQRIDALHIEHRVQSAEQRRSSVICVPLDLGGCAKQDRVRHCPGHPLEHAKTGNRRCRAAAQPRRHGHVAGDLDKDSRSRSSCPCSDYVECPLKSVRPVYRRSALRDHQLRPTVVANIGDPGAKVELNCYTEGIESPAQVGDRSGDPHLASEGCAAGLK